MKIIKRFIKRYLDMVSQVYKPCFDAGINPWI